MTENLRRKLAKQQARMNSLYPTSPIAGDLIQYGAQNQQRNLWRREGANIVIQGLTSAESERADSFEKIRDLIPQEDFDIFFKQIDDIDISGKQIGFSQGKQAGDKISVYERSRLITTPEGLRPLTMKHTSGGFSINWSLHSEVGRAIIHMLDNDGNIVNDSLNSTDFDHVRLNHSLATRRYNKFWENNPGENSILLPTGETIIRPLAKKDVWSKYLSKEEKRIIYSPAVGSPKRKKYRKKRELRRVKKYKI